VDMADGGGSGGRGEACYRLIWDNAMVDF